MILKEFNNMISQALLIFQFSYLKIQILTYSYQLNLTIKQITILKKKKMNPFQRLKKTIDNVGLTYLYPEGQQKQKGYREYDYGQAEEDKENNQMQGEYQRDQQNVPHFATTQGRYEKNINNQNSGRGINVNLSVNANQNLNKKLTQTNSVNRNFYNSYNQSHHDQNQQVQHLTALFQTQQTNYMAEINSLTEKLQRTSRNLKIQQKKNKELVQEVCSLQKQIESLKECFHKQEKSLLNNHKSDTSFDDRERKYKQEIYRINMTVSELATQINYQKSSKKALTKELQICRQKIKQQLEQNTLLQSNFSNELQTLKCQLQKRTQMFQHSVKAHSQQKKESKQKLQNLRQKLQTELQNSKRQEQKAKQESFKASKQLQVLCFKKEQIQKELAQQKVQIDQLKQKISQKDQNNTLLRQEFQKLNAKYNELKLKYSYSIQELQQQRNNVRVKVVQVTDQSIMLELQMYKRQCKELLQQKAILTNLKRQTRTTQANYKVVQTQTQIRNYKIDKEKEKDIKK